MFPIALALALVPAAPQELVFLQEQAAPAPARAWIGIGLGAEDDAPGVAIVEVHPDSPAQQVGLRAGDRVLAFAGEPVASAAGLVERVARRAAGEEVELTLRRRLLVELDERGHGEAGQPRLGITLSPRDDGVWSVTGVEAGWPAERGGVQEGDRIVAFQGAPLRSFEQLMASLARLEPGAEARVDVERSLALTLAARPTPQAEPRRRRAPEFEVRPRPEGQFEWRVLPERTRPEGDALQGELRALHEELRSLHEELRGLRQELQRLRRELAGARDR